MNNSIIMGMPKAVGIFPKGKITITENATDIDIKNYALADVNVSGGGDGITTNQIIRAMDLSRSLIDKNVILAESDYSDTNIQIMTDLMAVTVGGI